MSSKMTSLVLAAKNDEGAFDTLYNLFRPRLEKMAYFAAFRNSGTDYDEFLSAYGLALWDVVKRFDAERGVFEHMLNNAIYKANAYVVRKHLRDSRVFPSTVCDPAIWDEDDTAHDFDTFYDRYGGQLLVPSTEDVYAKDSGDIDAVVEQLCDAGASADDVKAARLLATGKHTDLEIARLCGHDGTDKAAGMWMKRLKDRLARFWRLAV